MKFNKDLKLFPFLITLTKNVELGLQTWKLNLIRELLQVGNEEVVTKLEKIL